jgi:hypothetical protein
MNHRSPPSTSILHPRRSVAIDRRRPARGLPVFLAAAPLALPFLLPRPVVGQERIPARASSVAIQPAVGTELSEKDLAVLLGSAEDARRISSRLTHRDRAAAADLGRRLREGASFDDIRGDWQALVRRSGLSDSEDVDALTRWVMREAYLDELQSRRRAADAAKSRSERGAALRAERDRLADRLREVDAELARLDPADDQQLTDMDLQSALQKQQQTLQTMSNVSKSMHDTAKALIQNMRG